MAVCPEPTTLPGRKGPPPPASTRETPQPTASWVTLGTLLSVTGTLKVKSAATAPVLESSSNPTVRRPSRRIAFSLRAPYGAPSMLSPSVVTVTGLNVAAGSGAAALPITLSPSVETATGLGVAAGGGGAAGLPITLSPSVESVTGPAGPAVRAAAPAGGGGAAGALGGGAAAATATGAAPASRA